MLRRIGTSNMAGLLVAVLALGGTASAGLVGHWTFDETSGTLAKDSSGNGNDGTVVGNPKWVPGKIGGAMEFDGSTYVNCGNKPSLDFRGQVTMAFWFKSAPSQNTWERFLAKDKAGYGMVWSPENGGSVYMGIASGAGFGVASPVLSDNQWHHYASTYDGTMAAIYIDGVLAKSHPFTVPIERGDADDLCIAGDPRSRVQRVHPLEGLMDDVRIYDGALNAREVQDLFAQGGSAQPRYSARTFSSKVAFEVFVQKVENNRDDARNSIGRTPGTAPLEIPACLLWEVEPTGLVEDWDLLLREMSQVSIPGLKLERATDADLKRLAGFAGLEFLDLTNTLVTDAGLEHLKGLTGLWGLDLRRTKITGPGLQYLKGLPRLQWLNLVDTQITDADMKYLEGLKGLHRVSLTRSKITDAGLEHLKGLSELEILHFTGIPVTDAGLVHLKDLTKLKTLGLNYTEVTDEGLGHLKGLTGLRWLNLNGAEVTGSGLANLAGLAGLQELWFWDSQMTNVGLEHLKGLTGLQKLMLRNTQITDAGLEHLKGLAKLETLDLSQMQITDAGLEHLKGLTGLRQLNLSGTQVTDAGVRQLKQRLPNLTIQK